MDEQFNPYRLWLGRNDGLPPANPHQWLGLAPGESDPETISRAADTLTARVRRIRPGPHLVAWQQLLDRIAAAKNALLEGEVGDSPAHADATDSGVSPSGMKVVGQSHNAVDDVALPPGMAGAATESRRDALAPASEPQQAAKPEPTAGGLAVEFEASPPSSSPPPVTYRAAPIGPLNIPLPPLAPGLLDPVLPPLTADGGATFAPVPMDAVDDAADVPYAVGRRKSAPGGATVFATVAMVIVVVGLAAWMLRDRWATTTTVADASGGPGAAPGNATAVTPSTSPVASSLPSPSAGASTTQTPAARPPENPPSAKPNAVTSTQLPEPPGGKMAKPSNATPPETPPPQVGPPPLSPSESDPPQPKSPPSDPAGLGKSEPKVEPAKVDPQQQAEYQRQTRLARSAMAGRDVAKSRRALAAARTAAQTPEEQSEVKRLEALANHLAAFWKAMGQLLARQMPAQEITVDQKPMIVVESSAKELTLRYEAKSVKYKLTTMPRSVVEAIAREGMGDDPLSKVLLGAFLAFDAQGDRQAARQLWEAAAEQGQNTAELMPELDRPSAKPDGDAKQ